MISRIQKVIVWVVAFAVVCCMLTGTASAQQALKRKIDSLFVIASSAEVHSRHLVEPAKDSIAAIGADAVPILVDKLTTKSNRERLTIIQILTRIGSKAVPYLIRSLKNPDGLIVQRVCWALGDIGDTTATVPLTQVTNHTRWQVREQALGALGDIGDARATDAITLGLADQIGPVRKAAVVSVGKIKMDVAVGELVHMLGDDFYGARLSAVDALLKLDSSAVVRAIGDSLSSGNPLVGDLGCRVLGEIGGDIALNLLVSQADSQSPMRRAHAAVAIVLADPDDNCGFIENIKATETDPDVLLKINSAVYSAQNE